MITRSITVDDISPQEIAAIFTDMDSEQQSAFFAEIWKIASAWPGAGWCQQCCAIFEFMTPAARNTISTLAEYLKDEA